ncbi:MAG: kelch repeat-containing protein [Candidatus Nitrosotenuis sp.]
MLYAVLYILVAWFTFEAALAQHWDELPQMPTPRTEIVAVPLGEKIFVIGGFDESGLASDLVEVFDTKTNSWSTASLLPERLHHVGAAEHEGKIYVVGGYRDGWIATNSLYIYDPTSDSWSKGADMPTARGALTVQFVYHILYAAGGADHIVYPVVEAYDHVLDAWYSASEMPTARDHLASAVVDGKMYVIGGRKGTLNSNLGANEAYDPMSDRWITLEPMPTPRGGLVATAWNGTIFVFGGESDFGTFNENEQYIPGKGWIKHHPMKTARHGLGAATINDKIYVIGGGLYPGLSVSGVNEVYVVPEFPFSSIILATSLVIVMVVWNFKNHLR